MNRWLKRKGQTEPVGAMLTTGSHGPRPGRSASQMYRKCVNKIIVENCPGLGEVMVIPSQWL